MRCVEKIFRIGVDLSIRSTGITIRNISDNTCRFYIISDKFTKKVLNSSSEINLIIWPRDNSKYDNNIEHELIKSHNIYNISNKIIECIFDNTKDGIIEKVTIEGISFGSTQTNSIMELAGLNYILRMVLLKHSIPFDIIPPTQLKKFAVGIGSANKDIVVESFCRLYPIMRNELKNGVKIDDIADSYFLSVYQMQD